MRRIRHLAVGKVEGHGLVGRDDRHFLDLVKGPNLAPAQFVAGIAMIGLPLGVISNGLGETGEAASRLDLAGANDFHVAGGAGQGRRGGGECEQGREQIR